eukprot:3522526-Prymnesium_polylepis.1
MRPRRSCATRGAPRWFRRCRRRRRYARPTHAQTRASWSKSPLGANRLSEQIASRAVAVARARSLSPRRVRAGAGGGAGGGGGRGLGGQCGARLGGPQVGGVGHVGGVGRRGGGQGRRGDSHGARAAHPTLSRPSNRQPWRGGGGPWRGGGG